MGTRKTTMQTGSNATRGTRKARMMANGRKMKRNAFILLTSPKLLTPMRSSWKKLKEMPRKQNKCGMKVRLLTVGSHRTHGATRARLMKVGKTTVAQPLHNHKVRGQAKAFFISGCQTRRWDLSSPREVAKIYSFMLSF